MSVRERLSDWSGDCDVLGNEHFPPEIETYIAALSSFAPCEMRATTVKGLRAVLLAAQANDTRSLLELLFRIRPVAKKRPPPPSAQDLDKMRAIAAANPWLGRGSELKAVDFIRRHFSPWLEQGLNLRVLRDLAPSYRVLARTYQVNKSRSESNTIEGIYVPPSGKEPGSTVPISQRRRIYLTEEQAEARRVRKRKNEARYEAKKREMRSKKLET